MNKQVFCIFLMVLYIIQDIIGIIPIKNASLFLFVIWCTSLLMTSNSSTLFKETSINRAIPFLVIVYLTSMLVLGPFLSLVKVVYTTRVLAPILMYAYLKDKTPRIWLFVSLVFIFCVVLKSLEYSNLIDMLGAEGGLRVTVHDDSSDYDSDSFAFIYALTIIITALSYSIVVIYRNAKQGVKKLLLLSGLIVTAYLLFSLVLKALFTTAIIVTVIGVILSVCYSQDIRKTTYKSVVLVGMVSILFISYAAVFQKYASDIGSDTLSARLDEVYNILMGNSHKADDFNSRQELNWVSIKTFLSNPIIGVNYRLAGSIDETMIGNHAEWFDDLARYGVFAFFLFSFLIKNAKKQYSENKMAIPYMLIGVLGFLNPIFTPVCFSAAFLFFPLICKILNYNYNTRYND